MLEPQMTSGIAEWYRGRKVFVTGGTGFMGKVLLEKLLRCCPEIDTIYVLARAKRGKSPSTRVAEFSKLPLFEKLNNENQSALKKLVVLEGDLTSPELGLGEETRAELAREVSVVFNLGASLRLEASLKEAIESNTVGTLKVLQLAQTMKNLEAFIHVSTAFCQCTEEVVEEKLYPPTVEPRKIIDILKWMDDDMMKSITPKILGAHPNAYTFSKELAENLIEEFSYSIPVSVVRPSIVCPTIADPVAGWVDSLNGPVGVMVGAGKGLIRTMLCSPENQAEVIPADIAINSIIAAAWNRPNFRVAEGEVPVYNVSIGETVPLTWGELVDKGRAILQREPFEAGLWYPNGTITTNPVKYHVVVFFLQLLPAYFIDFIMLLLRQKRFMVRLQNRILFGMGLLQFFTMKSWTFRTARAQSLTDTMDEKDKNTFNIGNIFFSVDKYMVDLILGTRMYCMKEPLCTLPKAKRQIKMLYVLDVATKCFLLAGLLWLTIYYLDWLRSMSFSGHPASISSMLKPMGSGRLQFID